MEATQGSLGQELEDALAQMDRGLSQAADAARRVQAMLPRIAVLEGVLNAVQKALATGIAGGPVPAAAPEAEPVSETAPATEAGWSAPEEHAGPPAEEFRAEPAREVEPPVEEVEHAGRCYLLNVESVGGSLDLRTVDQPIAEDPNVLDVALLDYDGKRATLKVWLGEEGDPNVIRADLEERLRSGSGWCVISLTEQQAA